MGSTLKPKSLSKTDPVILDIVGNSRGMVSIQGEHLIFRLHKSGHVEYDREHHDQYNPVRREHEISPEEIQEIMRLVERSEFLELAEHYPPTPGVKECYAVTDITIEYKNQSHNKRITISDYEPSYPETDPLYPVGLTDLLHKVFQIHIRNR